MWQSCDSRWCNVMSHTCRVMKATREAGVPIPPLLSLCEDDRSAREFYASKHLNKYHLLLYNTSCSLHNPVWSGLHSTSCSMYQAAYWRTLHCLTSSPPRERWDFVSTVDLAHEESVLCVCVCVCLLDNLWWNGACVGLHTFRGHWQSWSEWLWEAWWVLYLYLILIPSHILQSRTQFRKMTTCCSPNCVF